MGRKNKPGNRDKHDAILLYQTPKTEKRRISKWDILIIAVILVVTALIVLIAGQLPYQQYSNGMTGATVHYELGKVNSVLGESLTESAQDRGILVGTQTLRVEILTGTHKGETVMVGNSLSTSSSVVAKEGMTLVVVVDALDTGEYQVRVYNYYRAPYIYILGLLFLAALVLIGGKKGIMSAAGLIYTFICVLLVFLPLVARGYSPVWSAVLIVVLVTAATMVFINGAGKKTLSAILGTVCGALLSGVILFVFEEIMHISGFNTEEAESLLLIGQTTGLEVRYLLFSGILIASMGAVMDTAMSIVSSMYEIHIHRPDIKTAGLFKAGMNVGKDLIGTMSNTLILAFAGSSLGMIILLYSKNIPYHQLLNSNYIAIEITQALAASLGIILTVPMTAALTAVIFMKNR
jgi:uncharacterized membrane protein